MILCCGEALMDMVPTGPAETSAFLARPGGCAYTTAIAAARLGARVEFLGRIGTDFLGEALAERLASNGVGTKFTARRDDPATLAFVSRTPAGDARYAFYSNGAADRSLVPDDIARDLGDDLRYIVFGSISMVQEPVASTIEALLARESSRALACLDPNVRRALIPDRERYLRSFARWLSLSAIVKASSEDLEWLFPELSEEAIVDALLDSGPELAVVTRGARGALAATKSERVEADGFTVAVADTIGAGDTFDAALLFQLDRDGVRGRNELCSLSAARLRAMLTFANAAAAIDCTREGAEPPYFEEVERLAR